MAASAAAAPTTADAPMPDIATLLRDVQSHQKQAEAMQKDYTYHVHTEQELLDKHGGVKKTDVTDAESVTVQGVRIDRIVARDGKPLTPAEQQKENERIDKAVAKAKERQAKRLAKVGTDNEGADVDLPVSRIMELGTFSNPRRTEENGRSLIVFDYAGNPNAKTKNTFETVIRDLVGTAWIDEKDRVLVHSQGHFAQDFKLGGGLMADLHKGSSFEFQAKRVDEVWLPASIEGQGSMRVMLFMNFNGRMRMTCSDYRRFHTSATILPGHGRIDDQGQPIPDDDPKQASPPQGQSRPQQR